MKKPPLNPIRQLRDAAGLTQERTAARAGIRQGGWSTLEHYPTLEGVKLETLRRVALGLGVGVKSLIE